MADPEGFSFLYRTDPFQLSERNGGNHYRSERRLVSGQSSGRTDRVYAGKLSEGGRRECSLRHQGVRGQPERNECPAALRSGNRIFHNCQLCSRYRVHHSGFRRQLEPDPDRILYGLYDVPLPERTDCSHTRTGSRKGNQSLGDQPERPRSESALRPRKRIRQHRLLQRGNAGGYPVRRTGLELHPDRNPPWLYDE